MTIRFNRVYSNCCCSCSFEAEIIKIGQSSHKMYSNNILNFQESTTILNACTKSMEIIECTMYICMCVCVCARACACACVRACICVLRQHFFVETYLIKQYRHLLSTYFCFDPFKLQYGSYNIRLGLAYKPSVNNWFPVTYGPILGHHQGVYIAKAIQALQVHFNFVRIKSLVFTLVLCWSICLQIFFYK